MTVRRLGEVARFRFAVADKLYHGTTAKVAKAVESGGLKAPVYLVKSFEEAKHYANLKGLEMEDIVIFSVTVPDRSNLSVDEGGALEYEDDEVVWKEVESLGGVEEMSGEDSLRLFGTAVSDVDIPVENLEVVFRGLGSKMDYYMEGTDEPLFPKDRI